MIVDLMKAVLEVAGYDVEATAQNVVNCFLDYVDSGIWHNLDLPEAQAMIDDGELTIKQMCKALLRVR